MTRKDLEALADMMLTAQREETGYRNAGSHASTRGDKEVAAALHAKAWAWQMVKQHMRHLIVTSADEEE